MMKWYEVRAKTDEATRNILKSMRNQKLLARKAKDNGFLYVCIGEQHQNWLADVCHDFGASLMSLAETPDGLRSPHKEVYTAPCGEELYDPILFSHHSRNCEKCKEIKAQHPIVVKPTTPRAKTVAKIEPGLEFNLNGVVASLEVTRDRLYEHLETLEALLKNLQGYREAKDKLAGLEEEARDRIKAAKVLLNEGRY